jgi:hypothetical protein
VRRWDKRSFHVNLSPIKGRWASCRRDIDRERYRKRVEYHRSGDRRGSLNISLLPKRYRPRATVGWVGGRSPNRKRRLSKVRRTRWTIAAVVTRCLWAMA